MSTRNILLIALLCGAVAAASSAFTRVMAPKQIKPDHQALPSHNMDGTLDYEGTHYYPENMVRETVN